LTEVDGLRAWVDDSRKIVVVEASNNTVTIVGLPADGVSQVLSTVPRSEESWFDKTQELVESVVGQLGFPRLS
jgi:chemotaxis signal transduction protein